MTSTLRPNPRNFFAYCFAISLTTLATHLTLMDSTGLLKELCDYALKISVAAAILGTVTLMFRSSDKKTLITRVRATAEEWLERISEEGQFRPREGHVSMAELVDERKLSLLLNQVPGSCLPTEWNGTQLDWYKWDVALCADHGAFQAAREIQQFLIENHSLRVYLAEMGSMNEKEIRSVFFGSSRMCITLLSRKFQTDPTAKMALNQAAQRLIWERDMEGRSNYLLALPIDYEGCLFLERTYSSSNIIPFREYETRESQERAVHNFLTEHSLLNEPAPDKKTDLTALSEQEIHVESKPLHEPRLRRESVADALGMTPPNKAQNKTPKSVLFCSYSHKDEPYQQQFLSHLRLLERMGLIATWYDRKIDPGSEWEAEIDRKLEHADIIIFLVSPDFLSSEYCWAHGVMEAIRRHREDTARVIPVLVRACEYEGAPFSELQPLPRNRQPIKSWKDRDVAWKEITGEIRKLVENGSGQTPPGIAN